MLKLIRIRELIEFFPEFTEYQDELEDMPTAVFYFIAFPHHKIWEQPIELKHKCTACMAPIDQAMEIHPDIVKEHLNMLLNCEGYAGEQEKLIEELHLFNRELVNADNIIEGKNIELGNKIARKLAVDTLGQDFVEKMEEEKILRIDAKNGKSYWLTIRGKILRYRTKGRPEICTHVGDIGLDWDRVIAHAVLIRTDKRFCNMLEAHRR